MSEHDDMPLLVGLGDSVTWGSGTADPPATSYIGRAAALAGARCLNLAVPAILTASIDAGAVPSDASVVVLNVGTNDAGVAAIGTTVEQALEKVRAEFPSADALIAAVRARVPNARIVVITVRDLGRAEAAYTDASAPALSAASAAWNRHLRELAARHGAVVLDIETDPDWYRRSEYDPTGIHPTDEGAQRLAEALVPLLFA